MRSDQSFLDEIRLSMPGHQTVKRAKAIIAITLVMWLGGLAAGGTMICLFIAALWKYIHSS